MIKCKKEISSESEELDYSSECYQPDETAEADSYENLTDSSDSSGDNNDPVPSKKNVQPVIDIEKPAVAPRRTRSAARKEQDFIPESDGYFSHQSNKKVITDFNITDI